MQHSKPKGKKNQTWKWAVLLSTIFTATLYANYQGAVGGTNYIENFSEWLKTLTVDNLIAVAFSIVMAVISAHFYNHKGRLYANDKDERIDTPQSFSYVYRIIQVTTIVASIGSFLTDNPVFFELHNNTMILYIGISVATLAIILFVTAKLNLGEHYSPCFDSFVPKDIIRDGLYKYVRHPIYTANIILLTGMATATGSLWIVVNLIVLSIYYVASAYKEEEVLKKKFPLYNEYIRESNMFIPFPKLHRRHA